MHIPELLACLATPPRYPSQPAAWLRCGGTPQSLLVVPKAISPLALAASGEAELRGNVEEGHSAFDSFADRLPAGCVGRGFSVAAIIHC